MLCGMTLKSDILGSTRAVSGTIAGGFAPMLRGPQIAFAPDGEEGAPADDGPLSVDDATLSLLSAEDEDSDDEGDEEIPADDQAADGDDAPDEDDPASEDDAEEDEDDAPAEPASKAPEFWSAEEKAIFAKAPPEVQQLVAVKTAEAEKRVYAAKEETATARKEASVIADVSAAIDQQLERAKTIFQGKWDGVDWAQWAKDAPEEAFAAKFEFDAEREELDKLQTAHAATEAEEYRQFIKAEGEKLVEANHPLADPVKGKAEKQALLAYAQTVGFDPSDLKWAGAKELVVLHKAMAFDRVTARLATKPAKEPASKAAPAVRPSSPAAPRKSIVAQKRASVVGRAFKTGKMDDAVTALLAMED